MITGPQMKAHAVQAVEALQAAGVAPPEAVAILGMALVGLLKNESNERKATFLMLLAKQLGALIVDETCETRH